MIKMKKTLLLLSFFLYLVPTDAQTFSACGYYGSNAKFTADAICMGRTNLAQTKPIEPNMVMGIHNILAEIGLKPNFLLVRCDNIDNCYATNIPDREVGQLRYIVYDGDFLDKIEHSAGTDFTSMSVLAHEIGHHLQGHVLDNKGSRPAKELEADQFSGFVLYKLGATLEQALAAMNILRDGVGSDTHPPRAERLVAIEKGWQDARAKATIETQFIKVQDFGTIAKALYWQAKSTNNDYEKIKLYTEAIKNYSPFYAAYNNRGNAYININNAQKAYNDFDKAITIPSNKDLAISYYGRGRSHLQLRKYQDAINDCNHAITIGLVRPELAYEQVGVAYYYLGDVENAKLYLQKALDIRPDLQLSTDFLKKIGKEGN